MDELRHRRRTHKQREITIHAEDLRARIHRPHIAHDPWSEPNPIKARLVRIPRDQVVGRAGIKRPRLLARRLRRHELKVMRVDQRVQRWFLVIEDHTRVLARWLLQPLVVDGGFVEDALVFVGGEIALDHAGCVDLGIRFGRIAAGVFQNDCTVCQL